MSIELRRLATSEEFLAVAGAFLAAREAEHNLILGLCSTIAAHPEVYGVDPWFLVAIDAGHTVAAVIQTPPHNVLLSGMELALIEPIVAAIGDHGVEVPGVLGPTPIARAFADRWQARTGRRGVVEMSQRIFRLEQVVPPRPVTGAWRIVDQRDRAVLADWAWAFRNEALAVARPRDDSHDALADRWIRRVGRTMYVWDDGDTVAMAGAGGETPSGTRIGPVYTPPARRGRGYASNLVAAATQHQLDSGRRFCFLFTDLANPTSNKIYQALGYAPVIDVDQYVFAAAPAAPQSPIPATTA